MAKFRLIVCFDIEAPNLTEAYGLLSPKVEATGIPWETTDEWYNAEEEAPGDPEELQEAIMANFSRDRVR
jgi:hypothetical protein